MKKIHTKGMLGDELDRDISWRIKEIDDIKKAIKGAEADARKSILRAGIPILYAHWEGFVKRGSEFLLTFVNTQGLPLRALSSCFIVYGAKKMVGTVVKSGNAKENIAVVDFFLKEMDKTAVLAHIGSVNTESNLSSKVFERIAESLGIDITFYAAKSVLIDTSLLDRRNNIAHGAYLDVDLKQFLDLADEVIVLLRSYKTDLENIAHLKRYLATPAVPLAAAAGS